MLLGRALFLIFVFSGASIFSTPIYSQSNSQKVEQAIVLTGLVEVKDFLKNDEIIAARERMDLLFGIIEDDQYLINLLHPLLVMVSILVSIQEENLVAAERDFSDIWSGGKIGYGSPFLLEPVFVFKAYVSIKVRLNKPLEAAEFIRGWMDSFEGDLKLIDELYLKNFIATSCLAGEDYQCSARESGNVIDSYGDLEELGGILSESAMVAILSQLKIGNVDKAKEVARYVMENEFVLDNVPMNLRPAIIATMILNN